MLLNYFFLQLHFKQLHFKQLYISLFNKDLISSNSSQRTLRGVGEVTNAFQAILGVCGANHVRIRRHVGAN